MQGKHTQREKRGALGRLGLLWSLCGGMAKGEEVGREERGWHREIGSVAWGGARRSVQEVGRDIWWGMAGGRKQEEGEVATAPSPSYK